MEKLPLKLFGTRASFYTHRVQIALHVKGLAYEFIEEDLDSKSQLLMLYNPVYKKVPVLLHGENPIVESKIIIEYVDEVWKGVQLVPLDAEERAVVRFWCHFVDNKLNKSFGAMLRSSSEGRTAAISEFREDLKLIEGELSDGFFSGRRYFGGERIGMMDVVLGCGCHWITAFEELTGEELLGSESCPRFTTWLENFRKCEEVREVIPPTAELIEYAKASAQRNVVRK